MKLEDLFLLHVLASKSRELPLGSSWESSMVCLLTAETLADYWVVMRAVSTVAMLDDW